ncbi:MAG: glycosyltransferase WbuB [Actinomycetales bacterium]|nr:MAG: glycosyltransferase WbuB [Actinomycetales bacterium]
MNNRPNGTAPRVLILVQNLPVPFDRRVWLEAQALRDEGYSVSVVCPRLNDLKPYQVIDGIEVYSTPVYAPGGSAAGFVLEYAQSFVAFAWTALKARRRGKFAAVQSCNPPDIFWPIGRLLRRLDGSEYVFDHHDLCPELYRSRFGSGPSLPLKGLLTLERLTFKTAARVISTNESYASVAVERGGVDPEHVTVVRTGPDPERMAMVEPEPSLRRGKDFLATYIGVMGPQDGVDYIVRAADVIVNRMGRKDIYFALMGKGDSFDELVALRDSLGLQDYVEFMGRVPDETVAAVMSTADIGLSPDPLNPLNDVSTMNKTMEYMAYSLPVVAFDLRETKVSASESAVYVEPNDIAKYAEAIVRLIEDPRRRARMGSAGRDRVVNELAWPHQRKAYLGVYRGLLGPARALRAADLPAEV